jgi:hypothetical protein
MGFYLTVSVLAKHHVIGIVLDVTRGARICPRTDFLRISAKFTDTDRLRIFRLLISTDTDTDIQLRIRHGCHGLQLMNLTNVIKRQLTFDKSLNIYLFNC